LFECVGRVLVRGIGWRNCRVETDLVRSSLLIRGLAVLPALVVVMVCANGAAADRMRLNHADQAAAKRDVLHLSDLPQTVKWKATKISSNSSATPSSCSHLNYSSPRIVDTGQAGSEFATPGILVMNQVGLVADASMVGLIWKHIFAQPISRCIGDAFSQGGAGHIHVLSTTRLSFPRLAQHEAAYRILFQLAVQGKNVRGAFDMVVLGRDRTISMLMVMGIIGSASNQARGERDMTLIDLTLAETIAGRSFVAGNPAGITA
jgi:hypothetical protein